METTMANHTQKYLIEQIRFLIRGMTDEQRIDFMDELFNGYCRECGAEVEEGKICTCNCFDE
jgi:hypothetical protein